MTEHMLHDIFMKYDDYGVLREEIQIHNGRRHGIGKLYFKDGTLNREIQYSNGYINGIVKDYYLDGQLKEEAIYKDNLKVKILQSFPYSPKAEFKENGKHLNKNNASKISNPKIS